MTRLGIVLPRHDCGPAELLGAARAAEEAGLDSVWVSDHLWGHPGGGTRPALEGWTALATVAAATRRVTVGTLVSRATLRPPALLAAMAATVASIAPGRLIVGLGAGDAGGMAEDAAYGYPPLDPAARIALVEESMEALRRECPGVPLWVGGSGEALLRIAAGADGWNLWGRPEGFPARRAVLESLAGGPLPELSWAGSFPGEEAIAALAGNGAGHVIVAAGARNYRDRIARLVGMARRGW